MGEKKVTRMLLKVDLQCCKCYKKVKKILCSFPHVRDQVFDEKANTVTIKVVCCSPEKIRDKICCKGGASIKSIEIIPDKPPAPLKPKPPEPKPPAQPKLPEPKPPAQPKPPEPKPPAQPKPPEPKTPKLVPMSPGPAPCYPQTCCTECYQGHDGGPCKQMPPGHPRTCCTECYQGRGGGPCNQMSSGHPRTCCKECYQGRDGGPCNQMSPDHPRTCCMECYQGRGGGPCNQMSPGHPRTCCMECYQGRGGGPCNQMCFGQPVRYYDGYCGRPVYDSWGSGGGYKPCYAARSCGECFSDENPSACFIM